MPRCYLQARARPKHCIHSFDIAVIILDFEHDRDRNS